MLVASDLLVLSFSTELTQAGITYTCHSLHHLITQEGNKDLTWLQCNMSEKAVELAFRRYLGAQGIPFGNLEHKPFIDPGLYDITLAGRHCDLRSCPIFRKDIIHRINIDSSYLLRMTALVPVDQLVSDFINDADYYIFAFTTGLVTPRRVDIIRAQNAGLSIYLVHPLPLDWIRPSSWRPFGRLELESESDQPIMLEFGGQGADRQFQTEVIAIPSYQKVYAQGDFYMLAYVHVAEIPSGRVSIYSPGLNQVHMIRPYEWRNIWVYGMDIILAGYITRAEFRHRCRHLPVSSQFERWKFPDAGVKAQGVLVSDLYPLKDLFSCH
jgi:hypothetical protein